MAGIGVKLNNIYGKNTLTTDIIGIGYSTVVTIAPMLTVIGALCFMESFWDLIPWVIQQENCSPVLCFTFLYLRCLQPLLLILYCPAICQM